MSLSNNVKIPTMLDFDLGDEGDLFKAPEPIMEEPLGELDPVTSAISMISCGEDVIASQGLKVANIDSIHHEQLLSEVFSEWEKDLVDKGVIDAPFSEVLDVKIPVMRTDENQIQESKLLPDIPFQKSVSSGSLTSMEWVRGTMMKPSFLEIPGMDFGSVYGMRRAFSEGDIKTLGNDNMSFIHSPHEQPVMITTCPTEDRREKLSRYRNKKTKRNFGRRIKYACRKALADSQPRIRGRFAKTEEPDMSRRQ
ncbi:zinc finger protein CONSTANS-LIKE 1-like isoform X2 [Pistacia vera]|uniref:zinc finger protein CONSTANS-LIKE 1-like isoform X2 n=1 Tax=Pistacia vera TaxID=55513 RepID=UPI001262D7F4|nr:zinc finger protein CONSTANS-LIKE 1-like isoform X2 [Pistacia vera]